LLRPHSGSKNCHPKQPEDDETDGALEQSHSRGRRKTRANAEKCTDVLDMNYSKGVAEVRVAFTQSKLGASYFFRDLITPNAPEQERANQCQTPDISHGFLTFNGLAQRRGRSSVLLGFIQRTIFGAAIPSWHLVLHA
jgi:hypothetical protein